MNLRKESSDDHIIRSSPSHIICKITALKNFAKFTGNTCAGVRLKDFLKLTRKHLCYSRF